MQLTFDVGFKKVYVLDLAFYTWIHEFIVYIVFRQDKKRLLSNRLAEKLCDKNKKTKQI